MVENPAELFTRLEQEFARHVQAFYPNATQRELNHAYLGSLKRFDAMILAEHLQATKPKTILEVGSFLGFSTRWILEISSSWGAKVVSIDPGIRHRVFDNVQSHLLSFNRAFGEQGALTVVRAFFALPSQDLTRYLYDYQTYEPKVEAAKAMQLLESVPTLAEFTEPFDFYFIDGDHSFDSTKASTELCLRPSVRMGRAATIVVHDAKSFPDTVPAVTECVRNFHPHVGSFQVFASDADCCYSDVWQGNGFARVRASSPTAIPCDGLAVVAVTANR
jgi:predicted O-methyltransferase YrrM